MNVVAEIGLSHCGDFSRAVEIIHAFAPMVWGVKFQVYRAEDIWTDSCDIELRSKNQLTLDQYNLLIQYAKGDGLRAGASFFSDYGKEISSGLDYIKIASRSFPCRVPQWVVHSGKPLHISCGQFLPVAKIKNADVVYYACQSQYPQSEIPSTQFIHLSGLSGAYGYSSHADKSDVYDLATAMRLPDDVPAPSISYYERHVRLDDSIIPVDESVCVTPDILRKTLENADVL